MRVCKYCHKEFEPEFKNQVYCSYNCRVLYRRNKSNELYRLRKEGKYSFFKKCPICGKDFLAEGARKYCSKYCANVHKNNTILKTLNKKRKKVIKPHKTIKLNYKMAEFDVKMVPDKVGYHWEAFKNNKMVLQSAHSFLMLEDCIRDAKKAF